MKVDRNLILNSVLGLNLGIGLVIWTGIGLVDDGVVILFYSCYVDISSYPSTFQNHKDY